MFISREKRLGGLYKRSGKGLGTVSGLSVSTLSRLKVCALGVENIFNKYWDSLIPYLHSDEKRFKCLEYFEKEILYIKQNDPRHSFICHFYINFLLLLNLLKCRLIV